MNIERPRRRWYQFSLLSLFLATTLVALFMSLVVVRFVIPAARQRNAVAIITQNRGRVFYDWRIAGEKEPRGPAWARKWIGPDCFQSVVGVTINQLSPDEANTVLAQVSQLRTVKSMEIILPSGLDADGLAALERLDTLTDLGLTNVTDVTLESVLRLPHLQRLYLFGSISPDAISTLSSLAELQDVAYNVGRITHTLGTKADLIYSECSIMDLLGYFENKWDVKFQYSDDATALLKTYTTAPLLTATDMGISARDAFDKLLTPHGLGYRVEPQCLTITTRAEAEHARAGAKILQEKLPNVKDTGW